MSSNNDSVVVSVTGGNSSDLPGNSNDPHTLTGEAVLSFHNINYQKTVQHGFPFCKKTRVVERLSNISGIMKPGLNVIMGPQDGSRSLLLDVLAARKDPRGLSGDILINGKPRPATFTCTSGYVPQNDVVMHTLTVRDNLEFSAALRLPMTMTREEKRRRINKALELLCLDKESNVKPRSKELRKRTSIAMELVTEHPILFLDDPTTGLDWSTATDVISVLRSLTLVGSGKVIYHGPAWDASQYFKFADLHSAVFFMNIIDGGFLTLLDIEEDGHDANKHNKLSERQHQLTEKLANKYVQSSIYSKMRTELDPLLGEQKAGRSSALEEITCATPFWHQLWWIICRSFTNFKVFPRITVIWAFITVILAVSLGVAFRVLRNDCIEVQTRAGLLFLLTVFQCLTNVTAGEVLVIDRDRFPHEHTSGYYRVSSYFLGKLLGELVPRRLLPSIIFTVIVFIIAGVNTDVKGFFTMLFTIMMLTSSASSLPLSIGAGQIAKDVPIVIVTIYFVFMLFISGLYSINVIQDFSWIQYFSIPHYGFTALLHNEFLGQNFCPENKTAEISRCQNFVICSGEEFLIIQGIDLSSWGFWGNHVALACMTIILLSITYVELLAFSKRRCFFKSVFHFL
uniref:ATP-binding cassette sub-family G member 3-like isoform X2 n=1 Tax=Myodes glareolus TaxID=447135 RepID=UPI0020204658|nr:ATP-binding cassette sub-family G member 3-like isoform X2 [Myodes glareolus]